MTRNATPADPSLTFLNSRDSLPLLALAAVSIAVLATKWSLRSRSRKQLHRLTPEQLADIGLSRHQAEAEATLPFWRP